VRERLRPEGFLEPVIMSPQALTGFIATEAKSWAKVVQTAGVKMEE
jgi:hypothetical protein